MSVQNCLQCGRAFWETETDKGICLECHLLIQEQKEKENEKKEPTLFGVSVSLLNKLYSNKKKSSPRQKIFATKTKHDIRNEEMQKIYDENKNAGYVYLMMSGNGFHKIGLSKNVDRRNGELNRQFPVDIRVVRTITCYDMRKVEKSLHKKFANKRIEYEWFKLDETDIDWLMNLRNYELG